MSKRAIFLTSDLIFSTKVTGTARGLGFEIAVAGNADKVAELCQEERERPLGCILIDLGAPGLEIATAVTKLRSAAEKTPIIAYGSHVDVQKFEQAREAGCAEVMPRSRFSADLSGLLTRFLGE